MNTTLGTMKCAIVFVSLVFGVSAQSPSRSVNELSWLSGCWQSNLNGREIDEQWMKPAGGVMLGMARTVARGKLVEYEFTQIRQDQDGAIFYVAKPSGQPEASFKLVKLENKQAVFENLQHDFPQRIIYRLQADGSLFARVEGTSSGRTRGFDYPMKPAQCN